MTNFGLNRPLDGVRTLFDIDRALDSFFGNQGFERHGPLGSVGTFPPVDIREKDDAYVIEAELPGYTENDIEVGVDGVALSISSKKEEDAEKKDDEGTYVLRERRVSTFNRTFTLPDNADTTAIEADFKDGLLVLTVKKRAESQKRVIEIKKGE
jgi:HSP20 family molecular chaperone IbpA